MNTTAQSYKGVITFLVKFIGIYFIGNIAYGLMIEFYHPAPDPITELVSLNVSFLLNGLGESVQLILTDQSPYVSFITDSKTIIRAFEGCNGINVMIVYLSFLIAFKGRLKQTFLFAAIGLIVIYISNLLRVGLLYEIALHSPKQLYFFHKYFFTGLLYLIVFGLWYFWVRQVNRK